MIQAWSADRTTADIVELASLLRIPCIEVGNGESIPRMDHFASEPFYDVNPDGGFLQPAAAFRMHPPIPGVAVVAAGPPAGPADHDRRAPGRSPPVRTRSRAAGTRPFEGIRVADFTSFWAGPFLAHVLGMFGADVIHVESTERPDGARLMNHHPRTMAQWWERSPYFHATNTNKRGVTIDMSGAAGRDLARRLVAACDVIVENYSPRVMESFGLSWDDVRDDQPAAIMVRMPAFGLTGPWRDRTGFAMTMEQVSGMAWLSGFPEHDPGALFGPCDPRRRPARADRAVRGPRAAPAHRRGAARRVPDGRQRAERRRRAGHRVLRQRRAPRPPGNRGLAAAPQNSYPCADWDDDLGQHRWVSIAVADDGQWSALRGALGDPAWAADPALATMAGRVARHDDLDAELAAWCADAGRRPRSSTRCGRPASRWPSGAPVRAARRSSS